MNKSILIALAMMAASSTGCTVLSYDRAMPSLTWYWSHDAREQRAERKAEKQWEESLPTNSPAR